MSEVGQAEWTKTYGPLGIVGTSLGSAIALATFAHEPRLDAAVFNHISPFFRRRGVARHLDEASPARPRIEPGPGRAPEAVAAPEPLQLLRKGQRSGSALRFSFTVAYDLSFPTELSLELVRDFERLAIEHEVFELPCGHYTTAKFPFNWMEWAPNSEISLAEPVGASLAPVPDFMKISPGRDF